MILVALVVGGRDPIDTALVCVYRNRLMTKSHFLREVFLKKESQMWPGGKPIVSLYVARLRTLELLDLFSEELKGQLNLSVMPPDWSLVRYQIN